MSLNTTPRTWVSGEVVTAAEMNAEVRDAFTGIEAAWTAYTPTWTASTTNPAIGNGTIAGRSCRYGKTLAGFTITITLGSTTTVGSGGYLFGLPFTSLGGGHTPVGSGMLFDSSANVELTRVASLNSTTLAQLVDAAGARVGAAAPVVPAVNDILTLQGDLELA